MPRLKKAGIEERNLKVLSAIARGMAENGLKDQDMASCVSSNNCKRTFQNKKKNPESFTIAELRRMHAKIKFTDTEIVSMIKGSFRNATIRTK